MPHVLDHGRLSRNAGPGRINRNAQWRDVVRVHVVFAATFIVVADDVLPNVVVDVVTKLLVRPSAASVGHDHQNQDYKKRGYQIKILIQVGGQKRGNHTTPGDRQ